MCLYINQKKTYFFKFYTSLSQYCAIISYICNVLPNIVGYTILCFFNCLENFIT
jgi:hypothetical protein